MEWEEDNLIKLGQTDPDQFEKQLRDAAEKKMSVCIGGCSIWKLPDRSIIAYTNYLNTAKDVTRAFKLLFMDDAVFLVTIYQNVPAFKRKCRLLKHFNLREAVMDESLESLRYHWFTLMRMALKYLTFEELDDLINLKDDKMVDLIHRGRPLYVSTRNSDPRVFDFFYHRFTTALEMHQQVERLNLHEWYAGSVHSRSALKLVKLELSVKGTTLFWDIVAFNDWSLLGELKSINLLCTQTRRELLKDIVIKGDRVTVCLNNYLPKVLVDLVLLYLI